VEDIKQRFGTSSALWLIVGTARQDGAGKMRVTLSKVQLRSTTGKAEATVVFDKGGIEFSENRPPELQFAALAAEAARGLGYSGKQAVPARATKSAGLVLPDSPAQFQAEPETLGGLWMQQLAGVLTTPYVMPLPRPRERVFERTLAALIALPQSAPDRTVLLARALAYLDRRQAALKVLAEGSGTVEEKALRAYLDSDLPALTATVAQAQRPAAKLISQLELVALRHSFSSLSQGDAAAVLKSIAAPLPEAWRAPVAFYVQGIDLWTLPSAANVKVVLDREFPLPGYTAESLVRGKVALGTRAYDEKAGVTLELSPLVHARKWRAEHLQELCCRGGAASWGDYRADQYLDLLETDAERLAVGRLDFLNRVQGAPEQAQRLANLYDDVLFAGGSAAVVLQRLIIAVGRFESAPADQRARLGLDAFEHSRKLLTWETAQSLPLVAAWDVRDNYFQYFVASQDPSPRQMQSLPPLGLENDLPMRGTWAQALGSNDLRLVDIKLEAARSACDNTIVAFQPCELYVQRLKGAGRNTAANEAVVAYIEPRFKGNAARLEILASRKEEAGDVDAARALLTEAVRMPNAPAAAYASLGRLLQEQGKFSDAAKAYLSYPGLKTSRENVVAMSNYAGEAGLGLAMRGAPKEGRPLLERAASNRDGSLASLRSTAQLSMAAGDFRGSLAILQQAYQHYGMPETAASIASTYFMLGQAENGWSALNAVLPEAKTFAAYRAATVGLRTGAYDADAVLNWRIDTLLRSNAPRGAYVVNELALTALFQAATMDRDIANVDAIFKVASDGVVPREPAKPRQDPRPGEFNSFSLYTQAYIAFRKGQPKGAAEAWDKYVKLYDENAMPAQMGGEPGTFWGGMAYAALSLAKAGRLDEARRLPERLTPEGRPAGSPKAFPGAAEWRMPAFDRKLIAGIVAAFAGKHAEAERHFRSAQGAMEPPASRMIPPEYAFVEILEAVAKETGVAAYRKLALDFARGYQGYEPWAGWAYAFEAEHSAAGPQRIRAVALALKFDPQSERIARLDPELVKQAREWLRVNDPFIAKKRTGKEAKT
jgi:TolA-binding protein